MNCWSKRDSAPNYLRFGYLFLLVAAAALIQAGCGKPFNVKPRSDLPPAKFDAIARAGAVEIQAEPLTDEDQLYNIFNANLIMAGLLPVRIKISNTGTVSVRLKKAEFSITAPDGSRYKEVCGRQAFKRLMSYYGIKAYSKYGYKQSREEFLSYSLDSASPLGPGSQQSGLLFFRMPPETARQPGLSLVVKRLDTGAAGKGGEITLPLK